MMKLQTRNLVTKPSKQRKALHQAPAHIRHKLFAAPLSPELRASRGVKSLPVRSGDTVRVVRGDHKGFEGKVTRVNLRDYRIYVEGLTREKVDGTAIFNPVHPSKVVITNLNLDDKWRKEILEGKKGSRKKVKVAEKPEKPEKPEKAPSEAAEIREEVAEKKVVAKEKPREKKPRKRKKMITKKKVEEKTEKKAAAEKKPRAKKARAARKTAKKTEGGA